MKEKGKILCWRKERERLEEQIKNEIHTFYEIKNSKIIIIYLFVLCQVPRSLNIGLGPHFAECCMHIIKGWFLTQRIYNERQYYWTLKYWSEITVGFWWLELSGEWILHFTKDFEVSKSDFVLNQSKICKGKFRKNIFHLVKSFNFDFKMLYYKTK